MEAEKGNSLVQQQEDEKAEETSNAADEDKTGYSLPEKGDSDMTKVTTPVLQNNNDSDSKEEQGLLKKTSEHLSNSNHLSSSEEKLGYESQQSKNDMVNEVPRTQTKYETSEDVVNSEISTNERVISEGSDETNKSILENNTSSINGKPGELENVEDYKPEAGKEENLPTTREANKSGNEESDAMKETYVMDESDKNGGEVSVGIAMGKDEEAQETKRDQIKEDKVSVVNDTGKETHGKEEQTDTDKINVTGETKTNEGNELIVKKEISTKDQLKETDAIKEITKTDISNSKRKHKIDEVQGISDGVGKVSINAGGEIEQKNVVAAQTEVALLHGVLPLTELPQINRKVVRIFISSTFSDTKEERNALMRNVYPRLGEYCREEHGLEFQVVDMRWGVPEHATDQHNTTALCLNEITKCQEVSVGPNFVVILGDKYGYRPLQSQIKEEHFKILERVATSDYKEEWNLVMDWYERDNNSIPPVYLLKSVSSMIENYNSKDPEQRSEAVRRWYEIEKSLQECIRKCALKAKDLGNLSDMEIHPFFMSVTEAEVARGFLDVGETRKETCVCFLRNIQNINEHLGAGKAQKFIDLAQPGENPKIDEEAQKLLKKLKNDKVENGLQGSNLVKCDINWEASGAEITDAYLEGDIAAAQAAQKWSGKEMELAKHKEYLDNFCQRFHERIKRLVNHALVKSGDRSNQLLQQVCQHWETAKTRCKVFEGRSDIMQQIETYLFSDLDEPFVVHGTSGCGKTSIIAKAAESSPKWFEGRRLKTDITVVVRFLGTSPDSSNILQVLSSVTKQIYRLFDEKWVEPEKFSDVVKLFSEAMNLSTADKPIVIFLDSLDQLYPAYQAFRLKWLPKKLPPHTKLILSVLSHEFNILDRLKSMYNNGTFVEIPPLGSETAMNVVKKWLKDVSRTINTQQEGVVQQTLQACSLPLFARILFDQMVLWKSFDLVSLEQLQTTVKGAINRLYEQLEIKFGAPLVKHCLSFITASRNGLSEAEIDHILSIDDMLLNKIYNFWKPPFRRIPPLLWSRIRADINNYVVERSADNALVVFWYHRQFIMCAKERYLSDREFANYIHSTMSDYFSGKWSQGRKKPFEYTKAQIKRFGLEDSKASEDRRVPSQPYMYQSAGSTREELRFNYRKMSELPFHLIKSRRYKDLKKEVLFNFQYLQAKILSSSVHELTQEVDFCMLDKLVRKDEEVKVLLATLRLVQPYVARYVESFPLELSGRLLGYLDKSESIRYLVQQCDNQKCPLRPLITSFETPTVGIQQNIKFRSTPPWKAGGALACSKDFQTLYILDLNDEAQFMIQSWDLSTNEKIRDMPIEINIGSDIIFQAVMHPTMNWLVMFKFDKFRDHGVINVIDLETGEILRNISEYVYGKGFWNPFVYMTENYIAARFGFRLYLCRFKEDFRFDLNRPSRLIHNEKYFVVSQCNITKVRQFSDKEDLGVFDCSAGVTCISAFPNNTKTFLGGPEPNVVKAYKTHQPYKGQIFKIHRYFDIEKQGKPKNIKISVLGDERTIKEKPQVKHIITSPDNENFIVIYSGISDWESVLWRYFLVQPICRVTGRRKKHEKYPCFTYDGSHVVDVRKNVATVIRVKDGVTVAEEAMKGNIRDFVLSPCSNQYALMLEKEVVIMNVGKEKKEMSSKSAFVDITEQSLDLCTPRLLSGLPQEKGLHLEKDEHELFLKEYPADHDMEEEFARPSSVMSLGGSKAEPLNVAKTPNGKYSVQLYARLQVYDEKLEEIMYTPKKGDIIQRHIVHSTGTPGISYVQIHGNEALKDITQKKRITLQLGDKIVQTDFRSKAKFSIPRETENKLFIERIPSLVRVKDITKNESTSVRITMCGESFLYLSNQFLVTSKNKITGSLVNVYSLSTGLTVATHNVSAECVVFSSQENKLFIVDNYKTMRVYPGPHFNGMTSHFSLRTKSKEESIDKVEYKAISINLYLLNPKLVTVIFAPTTLSVKQKYIYVTSDYDSQIVSTPIVVKKKMEDLSKDGSLAISQDLDIYDVMEGVHLSKLEFPYWDENSQVHARFSDDNQTIYLTDKKDNGLYLYRKVMDTVSYEISFRCHAHGVIAPLTDRFYTRFSGNAIVTEGSILKVLLLSDKDSVPQLEYDSELSRAVGLIQLYKNKTLKDASSSTQKAESLPVPMLYRGRPTSAGGKTELAPIVPIIPVQ